MKRYRFRLATVLRVRRMEEETAKLELRTANLALRQAVAARDLVDERYRAYASDRTAITSAAELQAERLEAGLLAEQLAKAQRIAIERATAAALAQARWSRAAKRVAVIERLDARRRSEYVAEELRAEVALVDDLVTSRYASEQSDADQSGGVDPDLAAWLASGAADRPAVLTGTRAGGEAAR